MTEDQHPVNLDRVPGKAHYDQSYLAGARPYSLAHQIHAVLSIHPEDVLEVGVGSGITAYALRQCCINVTTLDLEPSLNPDLVGSVTAIPADNRAFDVGVCCQVLEHLPFEEFGKALRELRRVCRQALVLSLPDVTRQAELSVTAPVVGRRLYQCRLPRLSRPTFPANKLDEMGHHWEVGFRETPYSRIVNSFTPSGWSLDRTWRVPELAWHRFFLLRAVGDV